MSKEIRSFLLIYVVPICVLSLVMVFIAPPMFSVGILFMLCSAGLMTIGASFFIDWYDKKD